MAKLEVEHVKRSMDLDTRIPVACGMTNLHQEKGTPSPYRLVVAAICSPCCFISRCVGMYLSQLLDQMPSYIKNSTDIVLILNSIEELDENTFLFAEDATAIHPNINSEKRLMFLAIVLDNLIFNVDSSWPIK